MQTSFRETPRRWKSSSKESLNFCNEAGQDQRDGAKDKRK